MPSTNKTLYLIDGTAYTYRAFFAIRLTTSTGRPTGAIRGVANMLTKLIREKKPDYMVVVFDAKGKTFRDDLYSNYKANRPPMPDDLRSQHELLPTLLEAMGLKVLSIPGVEADDVIGTLATAAIREGLHAVIASSDKDLAQLVTNEVTIYDERQGVELGPQEIQNKFGVPPDRIIDYLTLVGDSSDNIPGVPLVGPKTAAKWLSQHGSLDSIVRQAASFKGKAGQNLRDSLEQLELSRQLVTLKLDVEVPLDLEAFTLSNPDKAVLRQLYTELEFNTSLRELDAEENAQEPGPEYVLVQDLAELDKLIDRIGRKRLFAFDTETTGFDMKRNHLVGVSISVRTKQAYYIPVAHSYPGAPAQLDTNTVLQKLKVVLEDPDISKVVQNLKFDAGVFARYGIEVKGPIFDTMLESYVLNSTAISTHSLDNLAAKYLNYDTKKFEEVAGKGKNQLTFDLVDIKSATHYASEDADIALRLHENLWPKVNAVPSLRHVFENIEMPLVPVLAKMENHGVRLDRNKLGRQSAELHYNIQAIEEMIYESAGMHFNISSPKQIGHVLFEILGLPSTRKTATGQPSTAEHVLRELAVKYDVPKLILEYRSLFKLKSTYTDKLPELIDMKTGRVHTSYQQAVAATGRLSSTDPNLQNIPIRTSEGKRIREAFVADPGCVLISIDYSQIELRLMAHLSEDPALLNAFSRGEDVHKFTASEVFEQTLEEVTSDQRRHAKAINFGLMYGMSAYGLSRQLQIEVSEAQDYIEQYFARYPKIREFMDSAREKARNQGFIETIYGRRLYLPDIRARNYGRRQHAERTAINAPLQGSAADIIKIAMIEVDRWLSDASPKSKMILQLHDELVLEVEESEHEFVIENVRSIMENATDLRVPLVADSGVGMDWAQAHD